MSETTPTLFIIIVLFPVQPNESGSFLHIVVPDLAKRATVNMSLHMSREEFIICKMYTSIDLHQALVGINSISNKQIRVILQENIQIYYNTVSEMMLPMHEGESLSRTIKPVIFILDWQIHNLL